MKKTNSDSSFSVSVTMLSQLVRYLSFLKVDINRLFRSQRINPIILKSSDERIPFSTYIAIEDEAVRIIGDPCFGLHMGEFTEPGNWSILGYMMMNCSTLGEAFDKTDRYTKILGNLIKVNTHIGFNKKVIVFSVLKHAPLFSRHGLEAVLSSTIRFARTLSGQQVNPLEVGFTYKKPESIVEYERIFCSPVLFEQKQNYLVLESNFDEIPVLHPNASLLEYFENYAREFLSEIEENNKTTRVVMKLILSRLDSPALSIGSIAAEMALSTRTLQNRLKDEGKVFSELLKNTREKLAKQYLRENYSVEEITYLLGFSEASVICLFVPW